MAKAFTPKTTFTAKVNDKDNSYIAGKNYTCRDGALYADLRSKLPQWEAEGLITILGDVPNAPPINAAVS
ncbi:hypothetical protein JN531_012290 [Flagellatimonas centrodinii]|uniref:hypothetical protein n=1 Tax=Flagellatimonas centrodinii TaxID=2806210 RepID=UPI001FEE5B01|nr:hypothetical protein [Flagellatimonas centrodinii]ULQ45879.1 hypothetical protein JN531_012290 [Flagellatimonas centrodinii]